MNFRSVLFFLIIGVFQNSFSQGIKVGLELAANLNPINKQEMHQDFMLGIHSGIKSQIQLKNNFYISTGLNVTQKSQYMEVMEVGSITNNLERVLQLFGGSPIDIDSVSNAFGINTDIVSTQKISIKTNHLQSSVMGTYQVKNFQIHLGGYAGILLTVNKKIQKTQTVPLLEAINISQFDSTGLVSLLLPQSGEEKYQESNSTDDLNNFDFGVISGISYTSNHLNFGIYYTQGFADFRFTPTDNNLATYKSLRFSVAYLIKVKKEEDKLILE